MSATSTDRHRGTKSSAVYRHTAQALVDRLRDVNDAKAKPLLAEATRLLLEFESWQHQRPTSEQRERVLGDLVEVNERAVVLFAKQTDYWVRRRRATF